MLMPCVYTGGLQCEQHGPGTWSWARVLYKQYPAPATARRAATAPPRGANGGTLVGACAPARRAAASYGATTTATGCAATTSACEATPAALGTADTSRGACTAALQAQMSQTGPLVMPPAKILTFILINDY